MEDNSVSKREIALTNILERLAKHVEHYDFRLDEIERQQQKLTAAVENLVYQIALGQDGAELSIKKLEQDFMRYRSDMFKLASDQSNIDNSIKEVAARQASIYGAQESTVQGIANLEGRFTIQENAMQDHSKHNINHGNAIIKELTEIDNHITKMNIETQRHMLADFKETHDLLESTRFEITNRLYAFEEIDEMLKILLVRTKPPEPKEASAFTRAMRSIRAGIRRLFGGGGAEKDEEGEVKEAAEEVEVIGKEEK